LLLRLICDLSGVVFYRTLVFLDSIHSVERAMRVFVLTYVREYFFAIHLHWAHLVLLLA
jgi:hypothetical protein